ncbi:3',5'-cyclic AMP phosphodiesterase CpdA [Enterobacter sp. BIGb0383]|uniref:phosphodiesterase n=1 Tax=unclassified Enterobacter TaxID=2608935 RepID=UPI000F4984E1|nr:MULTISPECIES: phosphodiesterase [unclassified Enterobacter]ROP61918.1 3',5'-cyclic AMP phosphodiesterase CpdA [Enterobacter sp. BIGb0383]ROS12079.1 3',5'-cyclic AMP phosphodiesterase CpdA [Enterobacter sp. BIGb0359]
MKPDFVLAQISDLHIKAGGRLSYRKVDTLGALKAAVARLNSLTPRPDAVAITGDLTDFGTPEEYAAVRAVLDTLTLPWFAIAGNHDSRPAFRDAFRDCDWLNPQAEFIQWCVDRFPVRLIGLDSTVAEQPWGELCPARLAWLQEQLAAAPEKPTIVMLHHHPFISGIDHMDRQNLRDADALANVLADAPQVLRILCGHVHRFMVSQLGSTIVCSAPGTSHQVTPDFAPDGPSTFSLEPAGFLLHRWSAVNGIATHYCPIGQFDGPWPFYDQNGLID